MPARSPAYDYIIVGAGSAGCVLAARLTEDPHTRVLLLEAGGSDRVREIQIPAAFSKLFKGPLDWNYSTEPEPHLNERRLYWPRGKVLGGSSSINAMIYIRGNPLDYDHWAALGNEGWSYRDVLPYFKKSENQERGPGEFHDVGGPMNVADLRYVNPLTRAFLHAAEDCGFPSNPDFNGAFQEGAGLYQVTQKNGRRHSAADAFLRPAMRRPNLTVLTGGHATRVLIERGRATGVAFVRHGASQQAQADREVILSGGAVNSPQLLLLSGIGPAPELERVGVECLHDLPGVGKNLHDHPMVSVGFLCTKPVSLQNAESLPNFLRYLAFHSGPLVSNVAEAGIFLRTRVAAELRAPSRAPINDSPTPDMQLLFGPAYYVNHGLTRRKGHAFGFGPTVIAPESRGEIALRSSDPFAPPAIRPNYFQCESDLRVLIEGVRISLRLARSKAFAPFCGAQLHPSPGATSDADLAEFIRREAQTLYHPVGSCKMGRGDLAVVDPHLLVRGIERLRVIDASIMPRVPSGNTNAPTIMLAEKAADLIRSRP